VLCPGNTVFTSLWLYPNAAKVGGFQSRGAKAEAVIDSCEPLAAPDLETSNVFMQRWGLFALPGLIRLIVVEFLRFDFARKEFIGPNLISDDDRYEDEHHHQHDF
jgi:hypothetical protein